MYIKIGCEEFIDHCIINEYATHFSNAGLSAIFKDIESNSPYIRDENITLAVFDKDLGLSLNDLYYEYDNIDECKRDLGKDDERFYKCLNVKMIRDLSHCQMLSPANPDDETIVVHQ